MYEYDARKDTPRQQSTYTVLTIYYVIAAFMFDVLPPSSLTLLSNAPQTLRSAMPCDTQGACQGDTCSFSLRYALRNMISRTRDSTVPRPRRAPRH